MTGKAGQQRGLVPLLVIATAQLMLVLDDSIVNIALPSIQQELGVNVPGQPEFLGYFQGRLPFHSFVDKSGPDELIEG